MQGTGKGRPGLRETNPLKTGSISRSVRPGNGRGLCPVQREVFKGSIKQGLGPEDRDWGGWELAWAGNRPAGSGRMGLRQQNREANGGVSERVDGSCGCSHGAGIAGAGSWRGEDRLAGRGLRLCRGHLSGHGAVVRTVTAAAGGQARLRIGREQLSERPQPEQQNQKNANDTPHRRITIYENHRAGNQSAPVRYHRGIVWFSSKKRKFH